MFFYDNKILNPKFVNTTLVHKRKVIEITTSLFRISFCMCTSAIVAYFIRVVPRRCDDGGSSMPLDTLRIINNC